MHRNLFTVLFSLLILAACTEPQAYTNDAQPTINEACAIDPADYEINADTAEMYIQHYIDSAIVAGKSSSTMMVGGVRSYPPLDVNNPDVHYFKIDPCELATLAHMAGEGTEVKAHMAIKPLAEGEQEIDLIFEVLNGATATYLDFTEPCPTNCE